MSTGRTPRALALLERVLPDDGPLAGDLLEEFDRRRSHLWLWWQVLGAIAARAVAAPADIRPLRLLDHQPLDAMIRTYRVHSRLEPVNISGSPIGDAGGLGVLLLAVHAAFVVPSAWLALLAVMAAGGLAGLVLAVLHGPSTTTAGTIQSHMRAS